MKGAIKYLLFVFSNFFVSAAYFCYHYLLSFRFKRYSPHCPGIYFTSSPRFNLPCPPLLPHTHQPTPTHKHKFLHQALYWTKVSRLRHYNLVFPFFYSSSVSKPFFSSLFIAHRRMANSPIEDTADITTQPNPLIIGRFVLTFTFAYTYT